MHIENNHGKINTPEEMEISKVVFSQNLVNDIISDKNNSLYKLFPSVRAVERWREL